MGVVGKKLRRLGVVGLLMSAYMVVLVLLDMHTVGQAMVVNPASLHRMPHTCVCELQGADQVVGYTMSVLALARSR